MVVNPYISQKKSKPIGSSKAGNESQVLLVDSTSQKSKENSKRPLCEHHPINPYTAKKVKHEPSHDPSKSKPDDATANNTNSGLSTLVQMIENQEEATTSTHKLPSPFQTALTATKETVGVNIKPMNTTEKAEESKRSSITNPYNKNITNPYKTKPKINTNHGKKIPLLRDSPPMYKPRPNREKLNPEVVKFTELVNQIYGSNDVKPEPMCPWCFVTDNLSTDRYLTGKCWHRFGKTHSCVENCYGCGVPMNGCDSGGNERCCTDALYIHDSMNITREESDINKVALVCKCCLRPCNSYSECVYSHGCWNSPNKHFVWRFCHIAGRALVYSELKLNCKGPGSIPKHAQDIIKTATELMYNELRDPYESSQYNSPFCHVMDQDSSSKWLVTMSFGNFHNYMPFF